MTDMATPTVAPLDFSAVEIDVPEPTKRETTPKVNPFAIHMPAEGKARRVVVTAAKDSPAVKRAVAQIRAAAKALDRSGRVSYDETPAVEAVAFVPADKRGKGGVTGVKASDATTTVTYWTVARIVRPRDNETGTLPADPGGQADISAANPNTATA